jgi:hypothetical protein
VPTSPQQTEPTPEEERAIVETLALILAAYLAAQATFAMVQAAMAPLKLPVKAVELAWDALWSIATQERSEYVSGPLRPSQRQQATYRAWFLVNSAKRIARDLSAGKPVEEVFERETRYARQHETARNDRQVAAEAAEMVADESFQAVGFRVFRWRYRPSGAPCSPVDGVYCRDLHGKVFLIDRPPKGRYPGMWHVNCRCQAVPVRSLKSATIRDATRAR